MKIAIPTNKGRLSMHFGHCDQFAVVEADEETKSIENVEYINPPAHEPGALPRWLRDHGVHLVIAAGMGNRARQLFAQFDIQSIVGASGDTPEEIVNAYLNERLVTGDNACDH